MEDKDRLETLLFSQREELGRYCTMWMNRKKVRFTPASVIGWLSIHGLLNVERCKEELKLLTEAGI